MKSFNIWIVLRMIVAGIFILSGGEKLLSPSENFLYVLQNYQILPWGFLQQAVAFIFPWMEVVLGGFLLAGLWTKFSLLGVAAMTASFIFVVGQAIVRHLPISSCGCFGELVKVPLPMIIVMDSGILAITVLMLRHVSKTSGFSLDQYFAKKT